VVPEENMKATQFLICPTCHLACETRVIEAISNTTVTAESPCAKCQRAEQRRRARLHAESEQALDQTANHLRRRRGLLSLAAVLAVSSVGCGSDSPTTPSAPIIAQVGGVWSVSTAFTSVSGGECVGSALATNVGARSTGTLQVQQAGSSLTATGTDDGTGASCSYTGTAGATTMALNITTCTASDIIGAQCANGSVRNVRLQTGASNLSVNGASASGTLARTYNVTTTAGAFVAVMTVNESVTLTKR
jgi:hypothetical protein